MRVIGNKFSSNHNTPPWWDILQLETPFTCLVTFFFLSYSIIFFSRTVLNVLPNSIRKVWTLGEKGRKDPIRIQNQGIEQRKISCLISLQQQWIQSRTIQQGVPQETSDKRVLSIHQQWTPTSLAIKVIYTFQDHNFQHQFSTSSTRTIIKTWLQHQPLAKSIAHPRMWSHIQTSPSETSRPKFCSKQLTTFKPSLTHWFQLPDMANTDKLLLLTTRSTYKHVMIMKQRAHILAAMMEWGGVRIYSPCMSRHEGVNTSRGACLMHWAMDVHEHCTASIKPVKSLPFSAWGGTCTYSPACVVQALHSRRYLPPSSQQHNLLVLMHGRP